MLTKKIVWLFKRHPFLYRMRFRLLSESINGQNIDNFKYNDLNTKECIPKLFYDVNAKIFSSINELSDLEKVKQICLWLSANITGGPGLSEASDVALDLMLSGKGGVCSDFAQIFNNFCVINNIGVREWGMTRIPFDKEYGGHSFNEVYSKELKQWILVDVYYCTYFVNTAKIPLSVVDFDKNLKERSLIKPLYFNGSDKKLVESINKNYFHKDNTAFMIYNYSNEVYDKSLKRFKNTLPVFVIHFSLYIKRKSYKYLFPFDNYKDMF